MHPYAKRVLTIIGLRKPSYLTAYFIDEAGTLTQAKVEYASSIFDIKLGDTIQTYLIDKDHIIYNKKTKKPVCFYYTNNPHPIRLHHEPVDTEVSLSSISLKNILESKVVTDLFTPEGMGKLAMLLLVSGITGGLVLVMLLNDLNIIQLTKP